MANQPTNTITHQAIEYINGIKWVYSRWIDGSVTRYSIKGTMMGYPEKVSPVPTGLRWVDVRPPLTRSDLANFADDWIEDRTE